MKLDWHGQQRAQRERIEFYDLRVKECCSWSGVQSRPEQPMDVWQQVKLLYIGCWWTTTSPNWRDFFNSVTTKILHRSLLQNDFIFVRPAVSTEYIENDDKSSKSTYKAFYPAARPWWRMHRGTEMVGLRPARAPFEDLARDVSLVQQAIA